MEIKKQLMAAVASIFLLLAIVSITAVESFVTQESTLTRIQEETESIARDIDLLILSKNMRTYVIQVQQWLTDISATRGRDGLNDGFDEAKNNAEALAGALSEAKKLAKDMRYSDVQGILKNIEAAFPPYYEVGKKMAQSYVDFGPVGGNVLMGQFDEVAAKISEEAEQLVEIVTQKTHHKSDRLIADVHNIQSKNSSNEWLVITTSVLAVVALLAISGYLVMTISKRFSELASDLTDIERGNLKTPLHLDTKGRTEFGVVARALAKIKQALFQVKRLEEKQKEAEARAEEEKKLALEMLANRFESKVQGIIESVASAATQLYQTAESMSSMIQNASLKANNVASASGEAAHNVQTVAAATEEMSASVREIAQQISKSNEAVQQAVVEMRQADNTSKLLEEATGRIGEIVNLIQGIAGQINLLSLNATIESARAGEAGKGFAVVAGEVKTLANQTTTATDEIGSSIGNIKEVSDSVITALNTIREAIDSVSEISSTVSAAVEEQTAATNEIASNMASASDKTSMINQDIGGVSQSSSEASVAAEQTLSAARMLSQQAENLSGEVREFLADLRHGE